MEPLNQGTPLAYGRNLYGMVATADNPEMAVKIARTLRYVDPVAGEPVPGMVDPERIRELVTDCTGQSPYAVAWPEVADELNYEEYTARKILRREALSSIKETAVNSSYAVRWVDVTEAELLPPDMPFEQMAPGVQPVLLEDPKLGKARRDQGYRQMRSDWGRQGGRGNKKKSS